MRLIAGIIWKTYFLLYFSVTLILLFPLFYLFLLHRSLYPYAFVLKKFWARVLAFGGGVYPSVTWDYKPQKDQTFIIVSNHTSYLDIVISYCFLSHYFVFMGKEELRKLPLFRIFFKDMNITVNRKSKLGSHRAFLRAASELKMGRSVMIFPEGTISKKAPKMQPFKNGAFKLAIDLQIPILPVTFMDNYKLLEDKPYFRGIMRPGISRIVVHKPIATTGISEAGLERLKETVKETIEKPFQN
jgi:1-acyl-sn-glycerol-3-phosphate acyltransferase